MFDLKNLKNCHLCNSLIINNSNKILTYFKCLNCFEYCHLCYFNDAEFQFGAYYNETLYIVFSYKDNFCIKNNITKQEFHFKLIQGNIKVTQENLTKLIEKYLKLSIFS